MRKSHSPGFLIGGRLSTFDFDPALRNRQAGILTIS
jgi:hypothetical protein